MILENAFDTSDLKGLVKEVVNEAKDLSYVINVELRCDEEKYKRYAMKFLIYKDKPEDKTRAQRIEDTLEILIKDPNYDKIFSTLLHSYNYIRKVAGKEEYKQLAKP